ncbi:MAG: hypothetical protein GXX96_07805 [Planctomycetaceae bacterium]|jgi:hypothetical protein|nr:hypothetical protein [Planctomycetaceae bacterium]
MSILFKELAGSPSEEYNSGGFLATRSFLIAWEDRDAFAAEVMGTASQYGGGVSVHYPGKPAVYAVRLRFEPFDPDAPDVQTLDDLTTGLNSYSGSFAKAIVDYQTLVEQDRDDGPANQAGTYLSYRMVHHTDTMPITVEGWQWDDEPTASLPADLEPVKIVPVTEHRLTWHQVINPPWSVIHAIQGKVNASEFLGCPAETLLFEGAEATKLFRAGLGEPVAEFAWQIDYTFRERSIKHGGNVYGWNHAYRGDPAGWDRLTNGSAYLYDAAEFDALFVSTPNT